MAIVKSLHDTIQASALSMSAAGCTFRCSLHGSLRPSAPPAPSSRHVTGRQGHCRHQEALQRAAWSQTRRQPSRKRSWAVFAKAADHNADLPDHTSAGTPDEGLDRELDADDEEELDQAGAYAVRAQQVITQSG